MKTPSGMTHKTNAINPSRMRSLATGVGFSVSESYSTGCARSARVVAGTPAGNKKFLASRGYTPGEGAL